MSTEQEKAIKVPRRSLLQVMGAGVAASLVPVGASASGSVTYSALTVGGVRAESMQLAEPAFATVYNLKCGEDSAKWPTLSCTEANRAVALSTSLGDVTIL